MYVRTNGGSDKLGTRFGLLVTRGLYTNCPLAPAFPVRVRVVVSQEICASAYTLTALGSDREAAIGKIVNLIFQRPEEVIKAVYRYTAVPCDEDWKT